MLLTGQEARDFMKSTAAHINANAQTMALAGKQISLLVETPIDDKRVAMTGMLPQQFDKALETFGTPGDKAQRMSIGVTAVIGGKPESVNFNFEKTADGDVVVMMTRAAMKNAPSMQDVAQGMQTGRIPGLNENTQAVEYTGPVAATQHQMFEAVKRVARDKSPYRAFNVPNFTKTALKAGS